MNYELVSKSQIIFNVVDTDLRSYVQKEVIKTINSLTFN